MFVTAFIIVANKFEEVAFVLTNEAAKKLVVEALVKFVLVEKRLVEVAFTKLLFVEVKVSVIVVLANKLLVYRLVVNTSVK